MASTTYSDAGIAPEAKMRFLAAPTDVNWGGNAHGGRIMEWMDEAAYTCATQWASQDCVSAYVGGVRFTHRCTSATSAHLLPTAAHRPSDHAHRRPDERWRPAHR